MTRPKDLPVALQSYAVGTYGAGPSWGGTAQRSAPGAAFMTPGVTLPAEVENYLHGNAFDAAQSAIVLAGQMPALNWGPVIAAPSSPVLSVGWSQFDQVWIALAASITAGKSLDYGKTWAAITLAIAPTGNCDINFDNSGNAVIVNAGSNIQHGTWTAYGTWTWANVAGVVTAASNTQCVFYEPTNALWVVLQSVNGTGATIWGSANRTAWTARTIPATWSTYVGTTCPVLGVGNGLVVAAYVSGVGVGGTFRTMRSADGGVTWTNDQSISVNAGITVPTTQAAITRPTYSPVDGLWYIAINQSSGTRRVQVFSSPDAITWTSAATLLANDVDFTMGLVALGSLLIGVCQDGRVFVSVNKGVSWFKSGNCNAASGANGTLLRQGGSGVMGNIATSTVASTRFGMPAISV